MGYTGISTKISDCREHLAFRNLREIAGQVDAGGNNVDIRYLDHMAGSIGLAILNAAGVRAVGGEFKDEEVGGAGAEAIGVSSNR